MFNGIKNFCCPTGREAITSPRRDTSTSPLVRSALSPTIRSYGATENANPVLPPSPQIMERDFFTNASSNNNPLSPASHELQFPMDGFTPISQPQENSVVPSSEGVVRQEFRNAPHEQRGQLFLQQNPNNPEANNSLIVSPPQIQRNLGTPEGFIDIQLSPSSNGSTDSELAGINQIPSPSATP